NETGMTGPNAKATGLMYDVRSSSPYSGYADIDINVPLAPAGHEHLGDAYARILIRIQEIATSIDILKQAAEKMPIGDFCSKKPEDEIIVPRGEAYIRVESSRGLLGCHVVSDGGPTPARIQFGTPSMAGVMALPKVLPGNKLDDLSVILSSMDLGMSEVDK
ncbi:MAG: NADH-quinone oxidoreductase subunit D, partial [Candidatus Poribacteria bacterium]